MFSRTKHFLVIAASVATLAGGALAPVANAARPDTCHHHYIADNPAPSDVSSSPKDHYPSQPSDTADECLPWFPPAGP